LFAEFSSAQTISGVVSDKATQEPLPFVNILVIDSNTGVITDNNGQFKLESIALPCSLWVKFIGYKSQEIEVKPNQTFLKVELEEDVQNLDEVTVKPDNSLDLLLLRKIIKNRKKNNPDNIQHIDYKNYARTSVFLNNINKEKASSSRILKGNTDALVASSDSTVMMPFFMDETITNHYRNQGVSNERTEVVTNKSDGVLTEINDQVRGVLEKRLTTQFNFYDNQINILQKGFPSPISSTSLLYYNVYITDSITKGNTKYFKFNFYPKSYKNVTFKGYFWVENKTWALTEIRATLPNSANVNFVSNLSVAIDYEQNKQGNWFYKQQKTKLNLSLSKQNANAKKERKQFVVQKVNVYNNLNNYPLNTLTTSLNPIDLSSDSLLAQERIHAPLDSFELSASSGIKSLKNNSYVKAVDKFSAMTLNGYYNLNKLDLGPYFAFYRKNEIEGDRLTIPLRTSEKLFKNFTVGGYLGYGFKNKDFAYGSNMAYQFKTEKRTIIKGNYYYDYFNLTRNKFVEFIKENPYQQGSGNIISAFTSVEPNPYMLRTQHFGLTLEHQLKKSVGVLFRLSHKRLYSNRNVAFIANKQALPHFDVQNILLDTRLSFDQDYDEGFFSRIYYGNNKPVFHFTTLLGRYNLPTAESNKSGNYANFNLSMKSRVNIGPTFLKTLIEGGAIIGDAPYPLLNMPRGTRDIGAARYHFNLLYHTSYVSDVYFNAHFTYNTGGILFNKLPLVKHLNLREIFTFKTYYGMLLGEHDRVMQIPDYLRTTSDAPYMEASAGITNIFKCLRVDYVRRLNTADVFDNFSAKHGIRLRIEVSF
jgi:hypothetical protein